MGLSNTSQHWSEADKGALRAMAGHQPATQIGQQLDRSKKAVLNKIKQLDLPNFPAGIQGHWTKADDYALQHAGPGIGAEQYARMHGFGVGTVRYHAKKLGVQLTPGLRWTESERQILRSARSIEDAIMVLDRSRRAVYDYARLIGVPLAGTRHVAVDRQASAHTAPQLAARVQPRQRKPVTVARIEWCACCSCPVSNWAQHYSRMPQCRIGRAG